MCSYECITIVYPAMSQALARKEPNRARTDIGASILSCFGQITIPLAIFMTVSKEIVILFNAGALIVSIRSIRQKSCLIMHLVLPTRIARITMNAYHANKDTRTCCLQYCFNFNVLFTYCLLIIWGFGIALLLESVAPSSQFHCLVEKKRDIV